MHRRETPKLESAWALHPCGKDVAEPQKYIPHACVMLPNLIVLRTLSTTPNPRFLRPGGRSPNNNKPLPIWVTMWNLVISHTPPQGDWVPALPNFGFAELFSIRGSSWIYFCRIKVSDSLLCQEQFFSATGTDFADYRDKDLCLFLPRDVMRKRGKKT